jgi:CRP-like cAMP-binding protein
MSEVKTYLGALMAIEDKPERYEPGQVIFKAGDAGRHMYVVRSGTVELRSGGVLLETVGRAGLFGEMALVDPAPRSATAVAGPDCTVVPIDAAAFHVLVPKIPGLALEVMRVMARRLRHTTKGA